MRVLGIESSCDETACAVVRNGQEILSNIIASQHDIHETYGGVFPELASRRHADVILPVIQQALDEARTSLDAIDLIAVAYGPGLIGALLVGLNTAKALSLACQKPLIGVNHIEAHIYAALMAQPHFPEFPCIGVVLSGAHTSIFEMREIGHYTSLAQTVDDAIGEAFDKVAKILDLGYPGGPRIEALAKEGDPFKYPLKPGFVKRRPLDFSFSGIKTGVLYAVKGQNGIVSSMTSLSEQNKKDLAASFQRVVVEDVIDKTLKIAKERGCRSILFGGGVTHNRYLRQRFAEKAPEMHLFWPPAGLSLDNAAMIAGLGYHQHLNQPQQESLSIRPQTRVSL